MDTWLILNGYRNKVVWIWCALFVKFLYVGFNVQQSLQNKGGYTRRIARSLARILDAAASAEERED
jgi:hypothetical protein